jgi:hypothetical protein
MRREGEELRRLESKTLDGRFRAILEDGLSCSPFEAEAAVAAVQEVYFPFLQPRESGGNLPGHEIPSFQCIPQTPLPPTSLVA